MQNNTQESWEEELLEYGILHSEDCRFYFEDSRVCDFDVGEADCCENMIIIKQFIRSLLSKQAEEIAEKVEGLRTEEVHTKECEYQRTGCDCGYVERCSFNKGISDTLLAIKQISNK